jgi:hypothetical protein
VWLEVLTHKLQHLPLHDSTLHTQMYFVPPGQAVPQAQGPSASTTHTCALAQQEVCFVSAQILGVTVSYVHSLQQCPGLIILRTHSGELGQDLASTPLLFPLFPPPLLLVAEGAVHILL